LFTTRIQLYVRLSHSIRPPSVAIIAWSFELLWLFCFQFGYHRTPTKQHVEAKCQWKCTSEYENAFKLGKLASGSVLVHYNVNLPIRLACDPLAYGVEAVISHVLTLVNAL